LPRPTLFPYTTLFRSSAAGACNTFVTPVSGACYWGTLGYTILTRGYSGLLSGVIETAPQPALTHDDTTTDRSRSRRSPHVPPAIDRKSTRLNSSHSQI